MKTLSTEKLSFDKLPCTALKGVGEHVAERLQKLGINTVQDLLFHLPFRYQDRTRITPIGSLRPGDYAVIEATIELADIVKSRRPSLQCYLRDGTGHLSIRFFYFNVAQQRTLSQRGARIRCFGEVRWGKSGLEMFHPEYRILNVAQPVAVEEHLTAIYPTTEGVQQTLLRKLTHQALNLLKQNPLMLQEYLPQNILEQFAFSSLMEALCYVHRPPPDATQILLEEGIHPAQRRLAFEELLAHQLSLLRSRLQIKRQQAPALKNLNYLRQKFCENLSFQLTLAQQRVIAEIANDLMQSKPMLRLVQGDVGSGKTVIAALAALQAIACNYQVALMAPTELLAEQHFNNFHQWFAHLDLRVAWLTSKHTPKTRKQILQDLAIGKIHLLIGTHALFQADVCFANLALIVIDEQHRFGVHQRLALREKGLKQDLYPHQLIMTATPIPRTLAMTAYADLDYSVIDELPPGRTPVTTVVVANQRRLEVIQRVRENCQQGKQAYWVCTLIEESELLQCQAAEISAAQLAQVLPELRIGLLHGRMKPTEKEKIMSAFKNKQIDLLVATTVIEVGVDVPNASLMIIENAERLGLAQLHQLRGRVGRGSVQSHCVLLYQTPLSDLAKRRLTIMRETQDGFLIAQRDLELRGPGELLGTRQAGLMQFKIANLLRDDKLISQAQAAAHLIFHDYFDLVDPLIRRWLGTTDQYRNV